ncbi:MAG: PQQ-like beta-propeller repeat protein [Anaerolineales bacterium]|nr:PQQ-like beta-propeller repeat protein [Anaerolineales bacterium]
MKKFWVVGFIVVFLFAAMYFAVNNFLTPINLGAQPFPLTKKWAVSLNSGSIFDSIVELSKTGDGVLLAKTKEGIYALQENSGAVMWFFGLKNQLQPRPAIAFDGIIYTSDSKYLLAISQKDGKLIWEQAVGSANWIVDVSKDMVLVNEVANDIVSFDAKTGNLLWRKGVGRGFVAAYIDGDLIYIPDNGIEAVDAQTGSVVWGDGDDPIGDSAFLDGVIYYALGDSIIAFDARKRIELWSVFLSGFGFKRPLIHGDYVFAIDRDYLYAIRRSNGFLEYKIALDAPQSPSFLDDEVYVRGLFNRAIWVFDVNTKKQIGLLGTAMPVLLGVENQDMISGRDMLVFATGNRLFAYKK